MTPEQFWQAVDQSGGSGACWPWTRAMSGNGYGAARIDGALVATHRYAWESVNGRPQKSGHYICHTCDDRQCCNPAHLFEGSPRDNLMDMFSKGRGAHQTATHCAKGHPWTADNSTPIPGTTHRRCRECHRSASRAAQRRYRAKRKAESEASKSVPGGGVGANR